MADSTLAALFSEEYRKIIGDYKDTMGWQPSGLNSKRALIVISGTER